MLHAPFNGLVLQRAIEVGVLITPGKSAFVLADTAVVKAQFGVPDLDVQSLKTGSTLTVELDALPADGRIVLLEPNAESEKPE